MQPVPIPMFAMRQHSGRVATLLAGLVLALPVVAQPAATPAGAIAPAIAENPPAAAPADAAVPATPPDSFDDLLLTRDPATVIAIPTAEPRLEDFAPLPGNVPWPTVASTTDGEAPAVVADVRYAVEVKGLSALGLQDQYQGLSTLWARRGEAANIAQINRRTMEDRDLIDQLLRSVGHYGGSVAVMITPPASGALPTRVQITVDPGPLYTFADISVVAPEKAVGPPPAAIVTPLLGTLVGDPVDAVKVTLAQNALAQRIGDAGHPFPVIGKPDIVIDHATHTATLVQVIDIGPRAIFGATTIAGDTQGFDARHLGVIARYKPGQPYSGADREDLRRALVQTGLFGSVIIKPVAVGPINPDGSQTVDIAITTESAPVRTIAASGGYSTGQGLRAEGSWTHRNLFRPEGSLTVRGIAAERQQVLITEFQRRNFRRRDQILSGRIGLSAEQQSAFDATTFGAGVAINRESNIIWQKPWTYSLGAEALITRQRDRSAPDDVKNTYFILAFPGNVTWDRSDDLLNPSHGFRLTGRASPEFTLRSGTYFNYLKTQIEGTAYRPFGSFVFAGRVHLGAIFGASRGRIAPDRRFYAGGGGSVRGFSYQAVGPTDRDGAPTGGNSITEAAAEVRYRFQAFGSDLGVVGFVDAGQVYQKSLPGFSGLRYGAGVGIRYFTSFGPVRIDIATPLARREGEPLFNFYVSIGQAF